MRHIINRIGAAALCYMAFHEKGFRSNATPMGQPADNSAAGEVRQLHTYVTNDDLATIETAEYFDVLWTAAKRVKTGDILLVSFDVDGTPGLAIYSVKIASGHVVVSREASNVLGGQTNIPALTGTLTGTVNGALVDVAATAAATAGGSTPTAAQVDTGIATAVASIVTGVNEQNKEMMTKINAIISTLVTAGLIAAP